MPQKVTHGYFRISRSGKATQILLLSHGGWSPSDKYTFVPKGVQLHFYSEHTVTNTGASTTAAVLKNQKEAKGGYTEKYVAPKLPEGLSPEQLKQAQSTIQAVKKTFLQNSVRVRESFGKVDQLCQIYNYSLSFELRTNEEEFWKKHQKGEYADDVDLMMLLPDTRNVITKLVKGDREIHLSDAFDAALKTNGKHYPDFHYAPCRYVEEGHWYSKLSHK